MPRRKNDFIKISKSETQKDQSFAEILKPYQDIQEEGWFRGKVTEICKKDRSLIVSADVYDLEGDAFYGNIKGFLPINYTEEDITYEFMEALDQPKVFSNVVGKEVKVYVAFTESRDGTEYPNIYGYEKL